MATEAKTISNPHYSDDSQQIIVCDFIFEDGSSSTVSVANTPPGEEDNPDWTQISNEFTDSEIKENTHRVIEDAQGVRATDIAALAEQQSTLKNETVFASKVEAFDMPEIKASKNRALKSKIRKATNLVEILAYSAAIILEENAKESEA